MATTYVAELSGVFVPVVTPFRDDAVDYDSLRSNLRGLGQTDVTGYFALGSNGEFHSLSDSEQFRVLEVFAEEAGDKVVMVGISRESTRESLEMAKRAAAMGFSYVSALTPSYFASKTTEAVLQAYYTRLADSSPLPLLVYNAPGFAAGVSVSTRLVSVLAQHPNVAGIKDSSKPGPFQYLAHVDPTAEFAVLAGSASFFYPALHAGAAGGVLSMANYLPSVCVRLHELFLDGRHQEAGTLHSRVLRVNAAVSGLFGVAGVKAAMSLLGYRGGQPRHPFSALADEERMVVAGKIAAEGFRIDA
jgi:4-hydroxy-2-oxoglutarate aldolase